MRISNRPLPGDIHCYYSLVFFSICCTFMPTLLHYGSITLLRDWCMLCRLAPESFTGNFVGNDGFFVDILPYVVISYIFTIMGEIFENLSDAFLKSVSIYSK